MGQTSAGAPVVAPAAPAGPLAGSELPVLDLKGFERTAAFLSAGTVTFYMRTIADLGETLLNGLCEPNAIARNGAELAEVAHKLTGNAGMFGFERLAVVGRNFGYAVQSGAVEAPALVDALRAAIEATRGEIHDHAPAAVTD